MLSYVCCYNGIPVCCIIQQLDNPLWFKHRFRILIFKRLIFLRLNDLGSPFIRFIRTCNKRVQHLENRLNIPDDRNVCCYVLAYFGRIDINMCYFGEWSKSIQSTGYTIIKACTYIDEKISILNGLVSRIRSVHTRHSHPQLMPAWESAKSEQRSRSWNLRLVNEFKQRFMPTGIDYSTACNDDRLFRFFNRCCKLIKLQAIRHNSRMISAKIDRIYWLEQCFVS
ncbi:hypothetical protein D3C78_1128420 [compost metagenome]